MIIAGIEGTAWNFGLCIYDTIKNEIILNSEFPLIGVYLDPKVVYKHHYSSVMEIFKIIKCNKIDLLTYSYGPGFTKNLKLIRFIVRYCDLFLKIPFLKVHHGLAHLGYCAHLNNVKLQGLCLYLSGGNSQIIDMENILNSHVIGQTLDISIGNALDKFGRKINLPHPAGGIIEKYANKTNRYLILPVNVKGMYFSFSGAINYALKLYSQKKNINVICRSILLNCFTAILEALQRAIYLTGKRKLIVSGGVLQNKILQNMLQKLAKQNECELYQINGIENSDNPRMIAITGYLIFKELNKTDNVVYINPLQRIDEIKF